MLWVTSTFPVLQTYAMKHTTRTQHRCCPEKPHADTMLCSIGHTRQCMLNRFTAESSSQRVWVHSMRCSCCAASTTTAVHGSVRSSHLLFWMLVVGGFDEERCGTAQLRAVDGGQSGGRSLVQSQRRPPPDGLLQSVHLRQHTGLRPTARLGCAQLCRLTLPVSIVSLPCTLLAGAVQTPKQGQAFKNKLCCQ